jgi:uracil-DNA glycosylase
MRAALQALTDELKRLKANGVRDVVVSDESLAALKRVVRAHAASAKSAASVDPNIGGVAEPAPAKLPDAAPSPEPEARSTRSAPAAKPKAVLAASSAPVSNFPPPPQVTLPEGDKKTRWDALYLTVVEDPVCKAHVRPGKKVVLGVGTLDARIFFCGEAPGADEEEQGEPFVGPAGQLLTRMIQGMGLSRSDVYIGNIMNWRPELPVSATGEQVGNRPPTAEEMAYCLPYLRAQLEIVNPELIVALGSTAAQGLLGAGSFKTLGEIRGQWKLFAGKPVMVTYHPSYILRNPTNRSKRAIWEDLLKVMERAALPISDKQRSFFLEK